MLDVEPLPAGSRLPPGPPRPPAPPTTGGPGWGGEFEPDRPRRRGAVAEKGHHPLLFMQEVMRQVRLVAWPSSGEASRYASVVAFTLLLLTMFLLLIDGVASVFVERVIGR